MAFSPLTAGAACGPVAAGLQLAETRRITAAKYALLCMIPSARWADTQSILRDRPAREQAFYGKDAGGGRSPRGLLGSVAGFGRLW